MTTGVFTIPLVSTDGTCGSPPDGLIAAPTARHFISGPENSLLRVLIEIIEQHTSSFPLVVLYGPTGVGKSHLLNGLVERQRHLVPDIRIAFGNGADFARTFARAVDVDSVTDWRDKQRGCDLLVLDDLQELASKPAAQQELLHTLDGRADKGSQSLLAVRQAPLDWKWMLPQLRSRLEGGLVIPIAVPTEPTTAAMFCEVSKQFNHGTAIDPPRELTTTATYNQVRQAALVQIQNQSNRPSTLAVESTNHQRLSSISKTVAKHFQVKRTELLGPSRRHSVVRARGVAFYLSRLLLKLSLDEIGQFFGGRDHTTVLYSWQKTRQQVETNPVFKHEIDKLIITLSDNFEIQRRNG